MDPTGPPAACDLGRECVELLSERPQRVGKRDEPGPCYVDPGLVEGVEPTGTVGACVDEPGLAEHLEVLRDCRLGDRRQGLQCRDDCARRLLAGRQKLEDVTADRLSERLEDPAAQLPETSSGSVV